jgi:murein DD-endopeptidase MepM/ murein hydrolase activator NlpD
MPTPPTSSNTNKSLIPEFPSAHQRALVLLAAILSALLWISYLASKPHTGIVTNATSNDTNSSTPTTPPEFALPPFPEPPPIESTKISLKVKAGDTASSLFKQAKFGPALVDALLASTPEKEVLSALQPGQELLFTVSKDQQLLSLSIIKSLTESHQFDIQHSGSYQYTPLLRTPEQIRATKEAVISDSLYLAGQRADIPDKKIKEIADLFEGVIDFLLDVREGDTFRVLYEEEYLDGSKIGFGNILAAEFTNQGKSYLAIRYTDRDGNTGFYSPEGQSMKKAFLKTPLDISRITSNFSLARRHPILNTIRAHKGTDYAAPQGTPIKATADGRITFADRNSSFGKLVVIQHGDRYATKYAHLSDYRKGIKAGVRVKQGDIIGYVGATGAATGPHLHYEFLVDGVQKDSRTVLDQLPRSISISNADKEHFSGSIAPLLTALRDITPTAKQVPTAR